MWMWLRGSSGGLTVLAVAVGLGAGAGAILFRYLIVGFTRIFTGYDDYSAVGHAANPLVPQLLPLMFAIVLATGISQALTADTIYTLKLRRRGIDIRRGRAANLMEVLSVRDAMCPVPAALPRSLPLNEMIARFNAEGGMPCRSSTSTKPFREP